MKKIIICLTLILMFLGGVGPALSQDVPNVETETIPQQVQSSTESVNDTLPTSTPPATEVEPGTNDLFDTIDQNQAVQAAEQTKRQVAENIEETKTKTQEKTAQFFDDLRAARDILVGEEKESKPLLRGMILPFFQPVFLLVMMTFGLWSGQLREKLAAVWVVPMTVVAAMVTAAFITVFIPDLRPSVSVGDGGNLLDRTSIDTAAIIPAILLGFIVGLGLKMVPVIAFIFAAAIGLFFGFTKITDISPYSVDFILFWMGFGMTSLIFSIFGLGLEEFFKTMGAHVFIKVVGFITVLSGLGLAIAVF